jgi:ferrochelatase
MRKGVLLVAHGTVDDLDDLPAFLANIRRGRTPGGGRSGGDAPPELVAELRRRYEVIGGKSPLNAINREVARKLEVRLGVPVRLANRLWRPYTKDVLGEMAREKIERVAVVPLAQHSAHVYAEDARAAGAGIELACAENWGRSDALCRAFAKRIVEELARVDDVAETTVLMTAHSLPRAVIASGDAYEREVRAAADAIAAIVRDRADVRCSIAFQSQGFGGGEWLGPDVKTALDECAARGDAVVVAAPVGFLADHVEILYDLRIEARAMAEERGMKLVVTPSLNADNDLIDALALVAEPLLVS